LESGAVLIMESERFKPDIGGVRDAPDGDEKVAASDLVHRRLCAQ